MVIKPLFSFYHAPDFHSVFDEPLHHEGCLIIPAAQSVKHKNKQHIKPFLKRSAFYLLQSLTLFSRLLVAGNSSFRKFFHDLPSLFCGKCLARLPLHRDVVFLHLTYGGYTVKTINSYHKCTLLSPDIH